MGKSGALYCPNKKYAAIGHDVRTPETRCAGNKGFLAMFVLQLAYVNTSNVTIWPVSTLLSFGCMVSFEPDKSDLFLVGDL